MNRDGKYKGNQRPEMAGTLCRQKKIMSDQQPTRPSCDLKFLACTRVLADIGFVVGFVVGGWVRG